MAGTPSDENDRGYHPDRKLHPLGKLGFHATALIQSVVHDEKTVTTAYASATMSQFLELMPSDEFARSLVIEMMATPAKSMMYFDTVARAARWSVDIAPTVAPKELSKLNFLRACALANSGLIDEPYPEYKTFLKLDPKISNSEGTVSGGFRQEGATGCHVSFEEYTFRVDGGGLAAVQDQIVWVQLGDDLEDYPPFVLFQWNTPIALLAQDKDEVPETVYEGFDV